MRILLVGHGCSPVRGSEQSFTWNWAWHLSKFYQVWVMAHPHARCEVEKYLSANPNPCLRFVWVTLPAWYDPWKPETGRGIRLRLHYLLWQREILRRARELHREVQFDLVHHVSWGTIGAPPLLWRLRIPFVWGPVGGGQTPPAAFRRYFANGWSFELFRTYHLRYKLRSRALRRAARNSALALATNRETEAALRAAGAPRVELFLDSGVTEAFLPSPVINRPGREPVKLLWVGQFAGRRALPLALEAMATLRPGCCRLLVIGDGPLRHKWERLTERMQLQDRVAFLERVPWQEMPRVYAEADIFLFTSLRDSFGTQVLEAMAHALPIVTLNHQGVGTFVPDGAGIKVSVATPSETVAGLAAAIRLLAGSAELRRRMGEAGWRFARTQIWSERAERVSKLYDEVLDARLHHRNVACTTVAG
jgi:glycosyltransferase involved in cell wall biosynthesis